MARDGIIAIMDIVKDGTTVLADVHQAHGFFGRLRGLMFYPPGQQRSLLLANVKMIHMCFVRFPLGIVVLDRTFTVLDVFIIGPWHVSTYYPRAAHFLETTDIRIVERVRTGDVLCPR